MLCFLSYLLMELAARAIELLACDLHRRGRGGPGTAKLTVYIIYLFCGDSVYVVVLVERCKGGAQ